MNRSFFHEIDERATPVFDKEKVQKIRSLAEPYLNHRRQNYKRYSRKDSPSEAMSSGKMTLAAWERYIVMMADGTFAGVSPQYTASGENAEVYQEKLNKIHRYNDDASVYADTMHYFNVTGAGYLFVSEDEHNEIVYNTLDSRSTIVVHDYGTPSKTVAALLLRKEGLPALPDRQAGGQAGGREVVEIITPLSRTVWDMEGNPVAFEDYNKGKLAKVYKKRLYWDGLLPVVPFEQKDGIAIFEPVISLIDMFENMLTNTRNMTQYNDHAKLLVKGHQSDAAMYKFLYDKDGNILEDSNGNRLKVKDSAWEQEIRDLYDAPAVFFPNDGDMRWLIKDVSYEGIISFLRELIELILMLSITPNLSDSKFSGNSSGVALSYKLFALEQMGSTIYGVFKKGYSALMELIASRLNMRNRTIIPARHPPVRLAGACRQAGPAGGDKIRNKKSAATFDWRDVAITFEQNIPTDTDQRMNIITQAFRFGVISQETAVKLAASALGADASDELDRFMREIACR
jgi:SPP1 family phage portal protein